MELFDYEAKPVKYLGVYPKLPIDAPIGYPHIIDLECLDHDYSDLQKLSIADLVVTVLFKYMPGALTAFLDLDRPKFHYILGGLKNHLDFCIKRDGRMVTVGFLNEKELGGWDEQHQYRIDGKATEQWTPIWLRVGDGYEETDAEKVVERASGDVYSFFMHEPWHVYSPEQEVELVCGLSQGRNF